jgi:hypothetical protein
MKMRRFAHAIFVVSALAVPVVASISLIGCGNGTPSAKSPSLKPGAMPEGETWTGVYFHSFYGYLHVIEEGDTIIARWKRTDQSAWGEMNGKRDGDLVRYTWTEHKVGLVGQAAESTGKGYFRYTIGVEKSIPELRGEFGLDEGDSGSEWNCKKQQRMTPDLKSISGDTGGVAPPAANPWK